MIESKKMADNPFSSKHTANSKLLQDESEVFWEKNSCVPSTEKYNLTICDAPKFIWFRNAKVGTRTVFFALNKAEIELTAESLFSCFYFPQEYKDYFKFAFVRNPWDRFVSGWLNKVLRHNALYFDPQTLAHLQNFENFVSHCAELDLRSCDSHFRHQHKLIDMNEIDFLGRLENFDEDIRDVFRTLSIPLQKVPTVNGSENRLHYSSYYTDESRRKVYDMYRKDIQIFGYEFEDRRP
jgi:hypothetical protein